MAKRTREQGLQLAFEYQQSGMKQTDFAQSNDVTLATLRYWVWKSRKEQKLNLLKNNFVEIREKEYSAVSSGGLLLQTTKAALQFEQLPNAQYLVQLLNGIHTE